MSSKRKRPVEWIDTNSKLVRGTFHQFGTSHELGRTAVTVAVVEDENGKVHKVDPTRLKFTDK